MKKTILLSFALLIGVSAMAQTNKQSKPDTLTEQQVIQISLIAE